MSAIIEDDPGVKRAVAEWERQISAQQSRHIKERRPDDIAMIVRNVREYPNGINQLQGAFPIYYKDKLEDVLKKYINVFTEEAKAFLEELDVQKKLMHNASGMSELRTHRLGAVFPEKLYNILKWYGKRICKYDFFSPEGMHKVKAELPMCFIGNMKDHV